jgi:alpha-N-arabinofuranosidase
MYGMLVNPKRSKFLLILCLAVVMVAAAFSQDELKRSRLIVDAFSDVPTITINKNIYGHFSEHLGRCIYGGFWVGKDSRIPNVRGIRKDVVEALRKVKIPVLRWPGGCFADEYHWRDGVGPLEDRPPMLNTHWGMVVEDNSFGTHEFMDLCSQLGCDPYVAGNVGSGSVEEMQDWVEYMTFDGPSEMGNLRRKHGRGEPWKLPFFGIGNENWGCGGRMRPEFYADLVRRYQTYVRDYSGNEVTKIAAGGAGREDYNWTEVLMREAGRYLDALSHHHYVVPGSWRAKGPATGFGEKEWFSLLEKSLRLDHVLKRHIAIMDRYDPEGRVNLMVDEWGTWYDVEEGTNPRFLYQQNSLRDALVAGIMLNIFNQYARRVQMATLAQTVNVLQAMILTQDTEIVLTPTYHVFDMYQVHQDAELLPVRLDTASYSFEENEIPKLNVSGSRNKFGKVHITVCNLDPKQAEPLDVQLRGEVVVEDVTGRVLTAERVDSHNSFGRPAEVFPVDFEEFEIQRNHLSTTIPAKSVVLLEVTTKSRSPSDSGPS